MFKLHTMAPIDIEAGGRRYAVGPLGPLEIGILQGLILQRIAAAGVELDPVPLIGTDAGNESLLADANGARMLLKLMLRSRQDEVSDDEIRGILPTLSISNAHALLAIALSGQGVGAGLSRLFPSANALRRRPVNLEDAKAELRAARQPHPEAR